MAYGEVVPMPTFPALSTMNFVAVDEPITNAGPVMPFGLMESCAQGEVVPIPKYPFSLRRIHSVREPVVFLVENARTLVGDEVETPVSMEEMRAVDVAVVVAVPQLAREQKVEALKRMPVPMPEAEEEVAK